MTDDGEPPEESAMRLRETAETRLVVRAASYRAPHSTRAL